MPLDTFRDKSVAGSTFVPEHDLGSSLGTDRLRFLGVHAGTVYTQELRLLLEDEPSQAPSGQGRLFLYDDGGVLTLGFRFPTGATQDLLLEGGSGPLTPHASTHQNGGADEISVVGLSGLLADAQTPLGHKVSHENGGSDEINVAGLSGLLADAQTPLSHAHVIGDTTGLQTALDGKQALDADLTALAALATTGMLARTAADTYATRTITGTTNQIVVSNGDGIAGGPALSAPQDLHTSASFAVATIAVGTTPATSGSIRLRSDGTVQFRNSAGATNVIALQKINNTSECVRFGGGTSVSIGNNGTLTVGAAGTTGGIASGLFVVRIVTSGQGSIAVFYSLGPGVVILAQDAANFTVTSGNAGTTNVYLDGSNNLTVENRMGGTRSYTLTLIN